MTNALDDGGDLSDGAFGWVSAPIYAICVHLGRTTGNVVFAVVYGCDSRGGRYGVSFGNCNGFTEHNVLRSTLQLL